MLAGGIIQAVMHLKASVGLAGWCGRVAALRGLAGLPCREVRVWQAFGGGLLTLLSMPAVASLVAAQQPPRCRTRTSAPHPPLPSILAALQWVGAALAMTNDLIEGVQGGKKGGAAAAAAGGAATPSKKKETLVAGGRTRSAKKERQRR